ncbi:Tyrocidine synthase 3 [Pseudoalteromonas holothuriae]|uniref:Tyrocidine synthase 3 n=1 Tax=Pseudoalteromonas holothuriae TaxID=2963714 RepID=A0ABN8URL7_9GAMM|nr:non-ribosomal peptide synthetase [Pseudoalteromonas sp. CIP111951]CAH9063363.1 Tyrocidine synthase 3 [Pseudoalteromonas sp. CIP111951]
MSVLDLLQELTALGVTLSLNGENLKVSGNKSALTDSLIKSIKINKADLVTYLKQSEALDSDITPLSDTQRYEPLPLSYNQRRLWFVAQLADESSAYNGACALRIEGEINDGIVANALTELVQRHSSLRTVFGQTNGEPWQKLQAVPNFPLQYEDLSTLAADQQKEALQQVKQVAAQTPFKLDSDLLLRAVLIKLNEEEHCLVLVVHHIVSDAWSQNILVRDLSEIYQSLANNETVQLGPLALQYVDYAVWEQKTLQGHLLEQKLAYWQATLQDAPGVHEIPLDKARPAEQQFNGERISQVLDPQLSQWLKSKALQAGTTVYVVMQALYAVWVARVSGQSDVVMGTPAANRSHHNTQQITGFFSNTLVLRNHIDFDADFDSLLQANKAQLNQAFSHQDVPFDMLVERLNVQRSKAINPLFQLWFSVHQNRQNGIELNGQEVQLERIEQQQARYDLKFEANVSDESCELVWEYNSDLFLAKKVAVFAEQFISLAKQIMAQPDTSVWQLKLDDDEIDADHVKHTAGDLTLLSERFAASVIASPERVGVIEGGAQLSYGELDRQSHKLAAFLQEQGIEAGDCVGVCAERSLEATIALLAIIKVGAAYVPMDPEYPEARLTHIAEQSQLEFVLVSTSASNDFPLTELEMVSLSGAEQADWLEDYQDIELFPIKVDAEAAVYVIFTSGSTGLPKGVPVSHKNLLNYIDQLTARYPFDAGWQFAQTATLATDLGNTMLFGALLGQGTLHVLSKECVIDGAAIADYFATHHIDVAKFTPSHFAALLDGAVDAKVLPKRYLLLGGENFSIALRDTILKLRTQQLQPCSVINHYGPTEATIGCLTYEVMGTETQRSVPIGKPFDNLLGLVMQGEQPVPNGVKGELVIFGASVTQGYLQSTADEGRFVELTIGQKTLKGYRTGDLVVQDLNGDISYLGRSDDQIKVRGYRIELGEIEHTLLACNDITQACVVIKEIDAKAQLIAYVVADATTQKITNYLKDQLPTHMVPDHIIALEQLPLTENGKLDRKALPMPYEAASYQFIAPSTDTELSLQALYQELLGSDNISANAHFFELGGHSLLTTRLLARVRQEFAVDLHIRDIFDTPVLSELAHLIDSAQGRDVLKMPALVNANEAPLSYAQQRLWFIDQFEGGSSHYNMPVALTVEGHLEIAAIRYAVANIIERHHALRTNFTSSNGHPSTQLQVTPHIEIAEHNLVGHSDAQHVLSQLIKAQHQHQFDLSCDLLIKVGYVYLSDTQGVLLINVHHIASDGWSMTNLMHEFSAFYEQYTANTNVSLTPLVIQYSDYAAWQQQYMQCEAGSNDLEYWRNQLAQLPAVHSFPLDYTRPSEPSFQGAKESFTLSKAILDDLQDIALAQQCTLSTVLHACYSLMISEYANEQDIVIGMPVANREDTRLESLIGFFINTIVLRVTHKTNESFTDLLARVKQTHLDALAHQNMPFDYLVEQLNPERSRAHAPLCQIMFSMSNYTLPALSIDGKKLSPIEFDNANSKFDLLLNARQNGEQMKLTLQYDTALFSTGTMQSFCTRLQNFIGALAGNRASSISDLMLLSTRERAQLAQFNAHQPQQHPFPCIHQYVESVAASTPSNVAMTYQQQAINYEDLNNRANRLARLLQSYNVQSGHFVGIGCEQGPDMVIAMLATLKVGASYVPLDLSYPAERLTTMLNDTDINVVLCTTNTLLRVSALPVECIAMDAASTIQSLLQCSTYNLDQQVDSKKGAYINFTSGSTGRPKGVLVPHSGIVRLVVDANFITFDQQDCVAQAANPSFDATTLEVWGALANGARLHFVDKETLLSAQQLKQAIGEHKISTMFVTTSLFNQLANTKPDTFAGMKYVVVGGEALSVESVNKVIAGGKPKHLLNGYGPTENTTFTAVYDVQEKANRAVPIGPSIAGTRCYVLSEQQALLPQGAIGELYVAGDGVAIEYVGQPEQTQSSFVTLAHIEEPKLYRTGDLVRWRADGVLDYIGRGDHQVKVRGFRIELGDIESALAKLNGVKDSCVNVMLDSVGTKRLIAYFTVSDNTTSLSAQTLKAKLQEALPDYMVPSEFVLLAALPLNDNGKLDRAALPAPHLDSSSNETLVPTKGALELTLAEIFQDLLNISKVGRNSDFFKLGGHSLLATRLAGEVQARLSINLPIKAIFTHPKLASLAKWITEQGDTATLPAIVPTQNSDKAPLSFEQHRLWFIDNVEGESAQYNMPVAFTLRGKLNQQALEYAFEQLVARHEILRTSYHEQQGQAWQIVSTICEFAIEQHDVSSLAEKDRSAQITTLFEMAAQMPFDLSGSPMLRVTQVREHDSLHHLLINIHHIACDGWSIGIIVKELNALYTSYVNGTEAVLKKLPIQFSDYAQWQTTHYQGQFVEQRKQYWLDRLVDIPVVHGVPLDKPRPARMSTHAQQLWLKLDEQTTARLNSFAQQREATLFMVLQSLYALTIARWSRTTDVVIGSPVAGRSNSAVADLVGCFVNTIAIRNHVDFEQSFDTYFEQTRADILSDLAHQELPFDTLVEALNPPRSTSHLPIFQLWFVLQNMPSETLDWSGVEMTPIELATTRAKFDIMLSATEKNKEIALHWVYNSDLFNTATIEAMAASFMTLVDAVLAEPEVSIGALKIINDDQKQQLINFQKKPEVAQITAPVSVVEQIASYAERKPNALAIEYQQQQLSFSQLMERANRLAALLNESGVEVGDRVGIATSRSAELLIAVVATMRLGAVFVPLDSKAPSKRLAYICEDSDIQTILAVGNDATQFDTLGLDIIMLDGAASDESWLAGSELDDCQFPLATQLAYILYTSGTTGQPKGVKVSHGNLASLTYSLHELLQAQGIAGEYRWAWNAPLMFDASLQAVSQLGLGASLVLIDEDTRMEPSAFVSLLTQKQIDIFDCTPAFAELLLNETHIANAQLPSLIVGGEAVSAQLWQRIGQHMQQGGQFAINAYGPTEATIDATYAVITTQLDSHIGRPLSNTHIHIVDEQQQVVPPGMVGECCIEGAGVSQGYLNQAELTARQYVEIEGADGRTTDVYRTGDLVRWRADGNLAYLGRIDNQVKLRGYRIELAEIEAALVTMDAVSHAALVVKEQCLIAYVVPTHTTTLSDDVVSLHLRETLADYMIPSHFVYLEALPVTANGKVNYRALPDVQASKVTHYVEPTNADESLLQEIWCELLKRDTVSCEDNFFTLGGHSLLAIRMNSAVKERMQKRFALQTLFEYPSIKQLAVHLVQSDEQGVQAVDDSLRVPLSYAQQRMWLIEQMDEGSVHYNIPSVFHLQGQLDVAALQHALQEVVTRHASLRTVIAVDDDGAYQHVNEVSYVPVSITDLSHQDEQRAQQKVRELVKEDALKPFNLTRDLMLRAGLIKLSDSHHIMMFNMHHIASDGWSISVLIRELTELYDAHVNARNAILPTLPVSYRDYTHWQLSVASQAKIADDKAYWLEHLKTLPQVHSLPLDKTRPARQSYQGAIVERHLDSNVLANLKAFSDKHGVTLFMTLQATLAVLLARWSHEQDIVIGTPVAGRTEQALEPMIGFFLNTLTLRNNLQDNPKFVDFLAATKDMVLNAFKHQDCPFELLVEELKPERSASHLPLFQIMFVLQNQGQETLSLPGIDFIPAEREEIVSKFDLLLNAVEVDGALALSWDYNIDLFYAQTVERMADGFICLLEHILKAPEQTIEGLNLLPQAQRQTMLYDWNNTTRSFPDDKLMHQLFIEQVSITPDAIAVVDEHGTMTYEALYWAAVALQQHIAEHAFETESLIAVRLPKGRWQLVATLAIMMSGSAYLPLDVTWPAQRCDQILSHANAVMVIVGEQPQDDLTSHVPQLSAEQTQQHTQTLEQHIYEFIYRQKVTDLAYVIFTSGSTGKPKGVAIEHRSVVNTLIDVNQTYNVTAQDGVLAISALSFDLSVYDLFGLLAVGGTVVFPHQLHLKDPSHWANMVEQHGVTIWDTVPASAELLVSEYEQREMTGSSQLRVVMMSGDWIPPTLPKRLWQTFSNAKVFSLGGATEGSIWSISYPILSDTSDRKSVPYGKPMTNQKFFVLSKDLEPCPVGVMGELHIGGVGVARCYYNDEQRSAASYIYHPQLQEKLYKTGDMGRYLADGNIEFIGRIDHQVKIRGFRIELGEIESVLNAHEHVSDAIVTVQDDINQVKQLVAYLVLDSELKIAHIDEQAVRRYLATKLPNYMVPSKFMVLKQLPLSANGKVDRKQLPAPNWQSQHKVVPPSTPTEQIVLDIWTDVLSHNEIGIETNFFELGGSSVHLIQVASKINAKMNGTFNVVSFFEHSTVKEMARFVDLEMGQQSSNEPVSSNHARKTPKRTNKLAQKRKQRA